jgi:hypothetical protein
MIPKIIKIDAITFNSSGIEEKAELLVITSMPNVV